jgi:putative ABC transport system ATP-binding protein
MTVVDLTTNPPTRRSAHDMSTAMRTSPTDGSQLEVRDLVIEYASGAQTSRPVDGLTFGAKPGSITLLLGPSGCGKTSVLSCLGALMQPTSGTIMLGETAVHALDRRGADRYRTTGVGIVFQSFELLPSLSATENVTMVLRAAGVARKAAIARATGLLSSLGLSDRLHHKPEQLSGGQQQRVAIARAIALDPALVLADEPTAHLDHGSVSQVLDLHRRLADEGRIVVVSTHDDRMLSVASQVIELAPRGESNKAALQPGRVELAAGDTLIRQGDQGALMYLISEGRLVVERREPDGSLRMVAECGPGEHVGEMAPLFNLPRSATVRAITPAVVEGMSIADFQRRFGVTSLSVNAVRDVASAPIG